MLVIKYKLFKPKAHTEQFNNTNSLNVFLFLGANMGFVFLKFGDGDGPNLCRVKK